MNQFINSNPLKLYLAIGIWAIGVIGLLFFVEQSSFERILIFGLLAFGGYIYCIGKTKHSLFNQLIIFAIIIRVMAVFAFPALSDDIYRFIWDGRLAIAGIHPFEHLPSYFLDPENAVPGITIELFNNLNSQNYYTIYPSIAQSIFYISAWVCPTSNYGFAVLLKGFLALLDIGSIWLIIQLLKQFKLPSNRIFIYAFNPLVIVEIVGNAHFEGAMIFFLLLAVYLLARSRYILSAIGLAAAVASKILPLMVLPFVLVILPWKKAIRYWVYSGIGILLFAIPMFSVELIQNMGTSINLYFQKFEFNASIYYIIRWIGFQVKGWNIIESTGPVLAGLVFVSVWILALFNRKKPILDWLRLTMWAFTIYFLLSTIVHPWYITTLVALSLFTSYRFPILWSGLIMLTYINYTYTPYYENLWIVCLEYVLVITMLIFELKKYNFTNGLLGYSNQVVVRK